MTAFDTFRRAVIGWAVGGDDDARAVATGLRQTVASVVLVEGVSDVAAIGALAELGGRDLERERRCVIPMGGATNIAKFLGALRESGLDMSLAGLCDAGEERFFRRALEHADFGTIDNRGAMAQVGFFVCVDDLEDELIRALGMERVHHILHEHGDLGAFRTFQNQPAQLRRGARDGEEIAPLTSNGRFTTMWCLRASGSRACGSRASRAGRAWAVEARPISRNSSQASS